MVDHAIAINSALMTLRKKRSSREIPIGSGELGANAERMGCTGPFREPEKLYAQREKERLLRKAIRKLRRPFDRAVEFQLRELSMEETAGMTGRLSGSRERTIGFTGGEH